MCRQFTARIRNEMSAQMEFSAVVYAIVIVIAIMTININTQESFNRMCDKFGIRFYESINCTAEFGNMTECPLFYTCPNFTTSEEHCVYQDGMYKAGERINTDGIYKNKCICHHNYRKGEMQPRCPLSYCMRFTNNECYQKFTLDDDCSIGEICPPFTNLTTCLVDGKTYREGEIFRPAGTCWKCLCQNSFNGTFEEPHCIREPCLVELFHHKKLVDRCLPFYRLYGRDEAPCCPSHFICPKEIVNMELISEADYDEVLTEENCQVGEWEVKFGTIFNLTYSANYMKTMVTCACKVPPLPFCYSKIFS